MVNTPSVIVQGLPCTVASSVFPPGPYILRAHWMPVPPLPRARLLAVDQVSVAVAQRQFTVPQMLRSAEAVAGPTPVMVGTPSIAASQLWVVQSPTSVIWLGVMLKKLIELPAVCEVSW